MEPKKLRGRSLKLDQQTIGTLLNKYDLEGKGYFLIPKEMNIPVSTVRLYIKRRNAKIEQEENRPYPSVPFLVG